VRVIGFLRAGEIALVRRKAAAYPVDRDQLEKFSFGDSRAIALELGDQIQDGADWAFERIVVPIDMQEQLELERRNDVATRIEKKELGTEPRARSRHTW